MIDSTFSIYRTDIQQWNFVPLAYVCKEVRKRNSMLSEKNLLSLSYGNIVRKDITTTEGLLPESFDGYNIVEAGDIVLRLTDLQNDKKSLRTGLVQERGIITSAYTTIRPLGVDSRWLAYTLHSYDIQKVFYALGSGLRQSMKFDDLKSLAIAVPPLEQQRRIAQYLDEQIAVVNNLIQMKRDQIEVAREISITNLFQQLKSHNSGNQSGQLPWLDFGVDRKIQFSRMFEVSLGKMLQTEPKSEDDLLLPYLNSASVNDFRSNPDKRMWVNPKEIKNCQVLEGDLIVIEGGDVGRSKFYGGEPTIIQNSLHRVRTLSGNSLNYAQAILHAVRHSGYLEIICNVATIRHLTLEKLSELPIPYFDPNVQEQIGVSYQNNAQYTSGKLLLLSDSIRKLSDYKSALINAAVTGAFDVTTGRSVA